MHPCQGTLLAGAEHPQVPPAELCLCPASPCSGCSTRRPFPLVFFMLGPPAKPLVPPELCPLSPRSPWNGQDHGDQHRLEAPEMLPIAMGTSLCAGAWCHLILPAWGPAAGQGGAPILLLLTREVLPPPGGPGGEPREPHSTHTVPLSTGDTGCLPAAGQEQKGREIPAAVSPGRSQLCSSPGRLRPGGFSTLYS